MTLLRDVSMDWIRKRRVYGPLDLNSLITKAVDESGAVSHAEGDILAAATNTNIKLREIGALGQIGIVFPSAGDLMHGSFIIPYDLDPSFDLGFKIHWTQSAVVTTSVTWLLLIRTIQADGQLLIANVPLTQDNGVAIAADAAIDADYFQVSPRGILRDETLNINRSKIEAGVKLAISIEADVIGAGIANLTFLGLEMDYVPQKMKGTGNSSDRDLAV